MQRFFIYLFLQTFYMFQAVPPPIIRSTKVYIQLQLMSNDTVVIMDEISSPSHSR